VTNIPVRARRDVQPTSKFFSLPEALEVVDRNSFAVALLQ